jgi:hypothetical protein
MKQFAKWAEREYGFAVDRIRPAYISVRKPSCSYWIGLCTLVDHCTAPSGARDSATNDGYEEVVDIRPI